MSEVAEVDTKAVDDFGKRLAGKYLTFLISEEEYGVEILKVQEIIQMQKITPVPGSEDYLRGVINLRGKVIPVVELRKKFNMETVEDDEKTAIVVMLIESGDTTMTMGIIIDSVREVMDVDAESIEKTPSLGSKIDTGFIMGICKSEGNVKMLLDIDKVLSVEELNSITGISE